MNKETTQAIGWTLFGITIAISLAAIIIVITLSATTGETERLAACVEAGQIWIKGTCI